MLDTPTILDLLLLVAGNVAFIVGTTPPAIATSQDKARAKKTGGDFINQTRTSSTAFTLSFHAGMVLIVLVHIYGVWQASTRGLTEKASLAFWSLLESKTRAKSMLVSNAQAWLQSRDDYSSLAAVLTSRSAFRIACVLMLVGGAIRLECFRLLGKFFTFDLAVQEKQKVIDKGLYGIVRHPSYTAMLILAPSYGYVLVAGPLMPDAYRAPGFVFWAVSMVGTFMLVRRRIRDEEAMLLSELGTAYKKYMTKVQWRLLPGIF